MKTLKEMLYESLEQSAEPIIEARGNRYPLDMMQIYRTGMINGYITVTDDHNNDIDYAFTEEDKYNIVPDWSKQDIDAVIKKLERLGFKWAFKTHDEAMKSIGKPYGATGRYRYPNFKLIPESFDISIENIIIEKCENCEEEVEKAGENVKDEASFKEYAKKKFKIVFGDELDTDKMNKTIKGVLDDNKDKVEAGDWGDLVGILNKSFGA